jgi:hypothetical protein
MQRLLMHTFQWFRQSPGTSLKRLHVPRSAPPVVEQLEDRRLLSVTYHGGPILAHVEIETVYYGSAWSSDPQLRQQSQQLDTFYSSITNSPYMDLLKQYGAGRGQFLDHDFPPYGPPSDHVNENEIRDMLKREITSGRLRRPNANRLYFILLPPNVRADYDAANSYFAHHSFLFDPSLGLIFYAVIPHPIGNFRMAGLDVFGQQTVASSEELVEAATNSTLLGGWWDSDFHSATYGDEIVDICGLHYGHTNGYTVPSIWSNQERACVLPSADDGWHSLGGIVKQITVCRNQDGRQEVFAIGADNALWHKWQRSAGGPWSEWESLGGIVKQIATTPNQDGRQEVFAIGADDGLWHIAQTKPNGSWGRWSSLAGIVKQITVSSNADGRLEVFAIGSNNALWSLTQTTPNDDWTGSHWFSLGGIVKQIAVSSNQDGRLEVFGIGADDALWHISQTTPKNFWSGWSSLGGIVKQTTTGLDVAGRLAVFAIGADDALWYRSQGQPNGSWSGWSSLGGMATQITAGHDAGGRLEVEAIRADQTLWSLPQTTNHSWLGSQWIKLQRSGKQIVAASNFNGGLELFVIGINDDVLWHT